MQRKCSGKAAKGSERKRKYDEKATEILQKGSGFLKVLRGQVDAIAFPAKLLGRFIPAAGV
jgi:hypothetical protein